MERIELFDDYIANKLSESQRIEFDARLQSDADFASDFKIYLLSVDGICREAQQDNLDFGKAMKSISKEKLQEIIGQQEVKSTPSSTKIAWFKPWIWQAASIAAVVVIAFTVVFNIERNAQYSVDNAIFACADTDFDLSRSGGESINIASMTDDELKTAIPSLENLYHTASSSDEMVDNGYLLAMTYVKLHNRDKAAEILTQLIAQFGSNEDYAEDVRKWKSILKLIK